MQADPSPEDSRYIRSVAGNLFAVTTKGELGKYIAQITGTYSLMDLQIIGGSLFTEIENLPEPYRSRVRPFFSDQIFGAHHRLLAMYRSGEFGKLDSLITDMDTFRKFCEMIPKGCFTGDEDYRRTPFNYTPKHRLFYYLMAAFTMFVLDKPGHPVGMPFPGGFTVEDRGGTYYCLIRDREKEVFFSICNFCPARQNEENAPVLNKDSQ